MTFEKMMRLMLLVAAFCTTLSVHGQLDTLYFEGFSDNRNNWDLSTDQNGSATIEDGFLKESFFRKIPTCYHFLNVPLQEVDTFRYEMRIVPEVAKIFGPAFLFFRDKKDKIMGYTAMATYRKGIWCFDADFSDAGRAIRFIRKMPHLRRDDLTFRITYGSGYYFFYVNDERIGSYKRYKNDVWNEWGWIQQGNSRIKIDYILLMAK